MIAWMFGAPTTSAAMAYIFTLCLMGFIAFLVTRK